MAKEGERGGGVGGGWEGGRGEEGEEGEGKGGVAAAAAGENALVSSRDGSPSQTTEAPDGSAGALGFGEFRTWLAEYVRKGSNIISDELYEQVRQFLKTDFQKGAKGQTGDAKFRHAVRRKKYHLVTSPQLGLYDAVYTLNDQGEPRRVVPASEILSVLHDVHVVQTRHGGIRKTHRKLSDQYMGIPEKVVRQFLLMCSHCTQQQGEEGAPAGGSGEEVQMHRGPRPRDGPRHVLTRHARPPPAPWANMQLELMNMEHAPDGDKSWILCAEDIGSRFTLLAALNSPSESAVAQQLVVWLTLVGPPAVLQPGPGVSPAFVFSVAEKVRSIWPGARMRARPKGFHHLGREEEGGGQPSLGEQKPWRGHHWGRNGRGRRWHGHRRGGGRNRGRHRGEEREESGSQGEELGGEGKEKEGEGGRNDVMEGGNGLGTGMEECSNGSDAICDPAQMEGERFSGGITFSSQEGKDMLQNHVSPILVPGSGPVHDLISRWTSSTGRRDWAACLPLIQWHMNSAVDHRMKTTPFKLALGRRPRQDIDVEDEGVGDGAGEEGLSSLLDDTQTEMKAEAEVVQLGQDEKQSPSRVTSLLASVLHTREHRWKRQHEPAEQAVHCSGGHKRHRKGSWHRREGEESEHLSLLTLQALEAQAGLQAEAVQPAQPNEDSLLGNGVDTAIAGSIVGTAGMASCSLAPLSREALPVPPPASVNQSLAESLPGVVLPPTPADGAGDFPAERIRPPSGPPSPPCVDVICPVPLRPPGSPTAHVGLSSSMGLEAAALKLGVSFTRPDAHIDTRAMQGRMEPSLTVGSALNFGEGTAGQVLGQGLGLREGLAGAAMVDAGVRGSFWPGLLVSSFQFGSSKLEEMTNPLSLSSNLGAKLNAAPSSFALPVSAGATVGGGGWSTLTASALGVGLNPGSFSGLESAAAMMGNQTCGSNEPFFTSVEGLSSGGIHGTVHENSISLANPLAMFLEYAGLTQFAGALLEAWVDMAELSTMAEEELLALGLPVGACKKLRRALARWQGEVTAGPPP